MVNLISFSIKKRLKKDYEKCVIEWHKKHINEENEEDFNCQLPTLEPLGLSHNFRHGCTPLREVR